MGCDVPGSPVLPRTPAASHPLLFRERPMSDLAAPMRTSDLHGHSPGVVLRSVVIGLTAFLTVVDLFATQAILPSLTRHYGVTPAEMSFAVNASTFGMAI